MATSMPPGPPSIPPGSDGPVSLSRSDAERVESVVLYTERVIRGGATRRLPSDVGASIPALIVKTTSAVGKATGTTYGTGTGTVQIDDGTKLVDDTGNTIDLANYHTDKQVNSGVVCGVYWSAGRWWVFDPASCAGLG